MHFMIIYLYAPLKIYNKKSKYTNNMRVNVPGGNKKKKTLTLKYYPRARTNF